MDALFVDDHEDKHAVCMQFVATHFVALSHFAWKQYLEYGRGLVIVRYSVTSFDILYLDSDDMGTWNDDSDVRKLHYFIHTYNPLCEVLCLVVHQPGLGHLYRLDTSAIDPQALSIAQPFVA